MHGRMYGHTEIVTRKIFPGNGRAPRYPVFDSIKSKTHTLFMNQGRKPIPYWVTHPRIGYIWESPLPPPPPKPGFQLTCLSINGHHGDQKKCLPTRGVSLWQVKKSVVCGWDRIKVSAYGRCPLTGSVDYCMSG